MMDLGTYLWMTFGVFVTLATFSFLYRDNPFYKFAEHLVVGVSAGYFIIILWHNALVPNLFQRLADGDWYFLWFNAEKWWFVIPAILGAMMWTRFSKKYSWLSRWPMALYIGISAGISVPLEMSNRVNKQLFAAMTEINWSNFFGTGYLDIASGYSQIIVFVGALSALIYFYFSKEHTGVFGAFSKFGIWILMIGFGASFGYTVMARISLFINRIQDVSDWGIAGFNAGEAANPEYSGYFQLAFWLLISGVLIYIVKELKAHLSSKSAKD